MCVFSEVFGSELCDCSDQLHLAMSQFKNEGHGLLFYLRFEARGAGLAAKVKATNLEIQGMDTYDSRISVGVSPECRDYTPIGKYLISRNVNQIRLLTNNPNKVNDLESAGVLVTREPLVIENPNINVRNLLMTKVKRFHHQIPGYDMNSQHDEHDPW